MLKESLRNGFVKTLQTGGSVLYFSLLLPICVWSLWLIGIVLGFSECEHDCVYVQVLMCAQDWMHITSFG